MLHFVLGRAKSGKTSYLMNRIKALNASGNLFIVPEQFSHVTERLLCERLGNSASLSTEVTSFSHLASKIKTEVGGLCANILGDGTRILYLHSAAKDVSPMLSARSADLLRPENLSPLLFLIDEFKTYGISPEDLARAKDDMSENLAAKISDVSLLYAAYDNRLGDENFDANDELAFVVKALRGHDFFADKTVFLDSFCGFTALQLDILSFAIEKARDVYVSLDLPEGYEEGMENGIFDEAADTKNRLSLLARSKGVSIDETFLSKEPSSPLLHLDISLFADSPLPYPDEAPEICISSSDNIFEECEKSAGYILEKVHGGARFRDFSVAVCDDAHLRVCEAVFDRYGIPSYTNKTNALITKPVITLLLTALEICTRGIRTELVMEYIKTGFSGISSRSLDIFENYLYTWSPKPYEWESGKDFSKNPYGLTSPETEESKKELETVNRVRRKIISPIKKLSLAIKKNTCGEDVAGAIYDFINDINLPRRVSAATYLSEASARFTEAQEYDSVLKILYDVIDDIGRLNDVALSADEIFSLTKLVLSQYKLATIPATLDCVNISTLQRADGERCSYRIVLGANDGAFPASEGEYGLLTDNDRLELRELGLSLAPAFSERISNDLRRVHSILCSAERGLYISSLTLSGKGEELYEAEAVSRISAVFKGISAGPTLSEARALSEIPCFDEGVSSGRGITFHDENSPFAKKLRAIEKNSKNTRGPIIAKENIEAVFGKKIWLSSSRADLFSSCRYAYFLRYGLSAYPKKRAEVSALEAGSLMHYVLEKVICRLVDDGSYDREAAVSYSREALSEYLKEKFPDRAGLSGRMQFLLLKIESTVISAVLDICTELESGSFTPREFELSFSNDGDLPALELSGETSQVSFSGMVDRIDTCTIDGKLYFRVVDYKSGAKSFSLDESVNGIGMQLLLYMFALEEMGKDRYGETPSAAGVMYVPLSRGFSEVRNSPAKTSKREGVVLSDVDVINAMEEGDVKKYLPVAFKNDGTFTASSRVLTESEFAKIKERLRGILCRIGDELSQGIIDPNPYCHKDSDACRWCDYRAVCAFDEKRTGDCMRPLYEVSAKDFLDKEESAE